MAAKKTKKDVDGGERDYKKYRAPPKHIRRIMNSEELGFLNYQEIERIQTKLDHFKGKIVQRKQPPALSKSTNKVTPRTLLSRQRTATNASK